MHSFLMNKNILQPNKCLAQFRRQPSLAASSLNLSRPKFWRIQTCTSGILHGQVHLSTFNYRQRYPNFTNTNWALFTKNKYKGLEKLTQAYMKVYLNSNHYVPSILERNRARRAREIPFSNHLLSNTIPVKGLKEENPKLTKVLEEQMEFKVRKADISGKKTANTLLLLFGFYGASEKAVSSYCGMYHSQGFDVIYVKSYLKHFAWPRNAKHLATALLHRINSLADDYENIIVHAMSMGAYSFTVLVGQLYQRPDLYRPIEDKIKAVVYDSIVIGSLKNMSYGVGRGASKNAAMQRLIPLVLTGYLNATYPFTIKVFDEYISQFKEKPLQVPTLVFYSKNDPMSEYDVLALLLKDWRQKFDFQLVDKCWERSKHAGHLQVHKEEYLAALKQFLMELPDTNVTSKL